MSLHKTGVYKYRRSIIKIKKSYKCYSKIIINIDDNLNEMS